MVPVPAQRRRRRPSLRAGVPLPRSLAGRLFLMQVALVVALVLAGALLSWFGSVGNAEAQARRQVTAQAETIADTPLVRQQVGAPDPSTVLEPFAQRVTRDTGVAFVTIMSPQGVRFTHPDPSQIGGRFLGHTATALAGHTFTETYTGTLGPSVRAVAPVFGSDGHTVTGLVSVGIEVGTIDALAQHSLWALLLVAAAALAVSGTATYLINARLRRHTRGMGAAELNRMYDFHEATLHAVREGLLLLDAQGRILLCNDGARTLLGLPGDAEGRALAELGLPLRLTAALLDDGPCVDQLHLAPERVVVVSRSPVTHGPRSLGTVVTLRDHTELQELSGELDSVRGFAEALRSQAHEAANRLHAVVSLIELGRGEAAIDFATAELEAAQQLTDQVMGTVTEPVLAALLLGKAAQAAERGVELRMAPGSRVDDSALPEQLTARELVTVLGNLVDNAIDAAIEGAAEHVGPPAVTVLACQENGCLLLRVSDTGPGVDPAVVADVFRRGWSTKSSQGTSTDGTSGRGLGLALVGQVVRRHGGTVEVGREDGAVFTVRLPVAANAVAANAGSATVGSATGAAAPQAAAVGRTVAAR
ncbi:ATP-binding protein [Streptacidiphilus sp. MAP12-16]|uniref:sensor histidine kinase n=1 Tax=Streptacidiphilus sp. MAP12-16 TaxID=3156300 RepID=UPI003517939F